MDNFSVANPVGLLGPRGTRLVKVPLLIDSVKQEKAGSAFARAACPLPREVALYRVVRLRVCYWYQVEGMHVICSLKHVHFCTPLRYWSLFLVLVRFRTPPFRAPLPQQTKQSFSVPLVQAGSVLGRSPPRPKSWGVSTYTSPASAGPELAIARRFRVMLNKKQTGRIPLPGPTP